MTMFLAPYTAIADIDGSPLDAGFLYLGEYGKDPASFPVEVFWDAGFTVPATQPIRTRNGYPVRNGSPAKVYLKTAQHSIAIKNRKGAFVLVDFYNKGWDASFVVDASGKNQQEINYSLLAKSIGLVSVLEHGAEDNFEFDSADAFQQTVDAMSEGWTLLIPPGKYYLSKSITIPKNINIMCCGEILLHHTASILITRPHVLEMSGTAFSTLPKKGDSKLNFTTAPELEYPSNHFAVFSSDEDEITRIGVGYYTPYKKRECLDIISKDFKLRAPVKLTYTDSPALTVRFYKRAPKVTVSGLRIKVKPEVGITNKPNLLYIYGASDIEFVDCHIDRLDTNWTGINIRILNCCGISFRNTSVYGANSTAAGDSYAFLLETSTFIDFYKCGYKDGNNVARSERGYAARHGSNITFDKCEFAGVDDHYGHDYTIENMTFNGRGASIAGGSLTLNNCHAIGSTGILVTLRNDTPFADGELILNNCSSEYLVLSSERASDARSTKRKVWDRIVFNNVICGNVVSGYAAILMTGFLPTDARQKTKEFIVRDSKHTRKTPAIGSCFFFGSTASDDGGTKFRWAESVKFFNTEFKNEIAGDGSFGQKYVSLLRLNADKIGFYNCSGIATSDVDCDDLTIGSDSQIGNLDAYALSVTDNTKTVNIFNSEISAYITLSAANNTTEVSLVGNLIKLPIFSSGRKLPQQVVLMSGNRAPVGTNLSDAPGSIMSYVNPSKYLAGTNAVSYDPPSIAAGAKVEAIVSLPGATVGNPVVASFDQYNEDIRVSASVSSADTVTVRFRNTSAAAIDLPSGIIRVKLV